MRMAEDERLDVQAWARAAEIKSGQGIRKKGFEGEESSIKKERNVVLSMLLPAAASSQRMFLDGDLVSLKQSIHSEACKKLAAGLKRGTRFELQYEVRICCMALDNRGRLLALGLEDGVLVIDMSLETKAARSRCSMSPGELGRYALDGPVAAIAWNFSNTKLASASAEMNLIYVHEVNFTQRLFEESNRYILRPTLSAGIQGRRGYSCVAFGRDDIVLAGAHCGLLQGWEEQSAARHSRTSHRFWDVALGPELGTGPGGRRHRSPVIALATTHSAEAIAATADSISIFDLTKRTQKAFESSTAKPVRLWMKSASELFQLPGPRLCGLSIPKSHRYIILSAQLTSNAILPICAAALLDPGTATVLCLFLADKPSLGPFLALPFCDSALRHCCALISTCRLPQKKSNLRGPPPTGIAICRLALPSKIAKYRNVVADNPKNQLTRDQPSTKNQDTADSSCEQPKSASLLLSLGPEAEKEEVRRSLDIAISEKNTPYKDFIYQEDTAFSPRDERSFSTRNPDSSTIIALASHPSSGQVLVAYADGAILVMDPT